MEKLLTSKEVAEIFGVDVRTVLYNFVPHGLKYVKVCRVYRFTSKDVEEFIEKQKIQKHQDMFIDTRTDYQKQMNKRLRVV